MGLLGAIIGGAALEDGHSIHKPLKQRLRRLHVVYIGLP